MPTLKVGPNNTIQYVTSNGDVLSEVKFDPDTGSFRFVDGVDDPAPAELGPASVPSLDVDGTGLTLEEDGGDLVYTDSNSNVVFRYNEDTGTWEMDSLSTDALSTGITDCVDVIGDRSTNQEYENTDSTNRLVRVVVQSDGTQNLQYFLRFGNTSGATDPVDEIRLDANDISDKTRFGFDLEVPPAAYYELQEGGSNEGTILRWREANRA
jgi:hypothetical protein